MGIGLFKILKVLDGLRHFHDSFICSKNHQSGEMSFRPKLKLFAAGWENANGGFAVESSYNEGIDPCTPAKAIKYFAPATRNI